MLEPVATGPSAPPPVEHGIARLLEKLIADYAATGLPPAYLVQEEPTATVHPAEEDETR
jgi:hypothetical protein